MPDFRNQAIAWLLAYAATAAASPRENMMRSMYGSADLGWRPEYAAMRPAPSAAAPPEMPGFPAHHSWYWGDDSNAVGPDGSGNPIVNITGYVHPEQQRILSAERFSDSVSSITCPSGQIVFTLEDKAAFDSAQQWSWVNTGNRSVVIVLEAGTCGNSKRQPYQAQNVAFNAGARTATYKASVSNWEDSCPGYHVVADTQGIVDQSSADATLNKRVAVDAGIDLTHDFSGNIFQAPDVANSSIDFNLDCKACSTSGKLNFHFDASLDLGGLFSGGGAFKASADVHPSGAGANVELAFKLGGELSKELSFNPSLPPFTLPGGISAGPLVIGPNLLVSYLAQLSSVSAEAELDIGTKITIDDSAVASIGIAEGSNTFSGWAPHFEQIGPELSASVSVSAQTGPQISVELSATVFSKGLTAGILLAAPQLTATLSANADTAGGVCGNADADLGANIDVGIVAELDAFGGIDDPSDQFPNKFPLFSTSQALFSTCATFGGGAAPTDSAAASSSVVASVPATSSAADPVSTSASASASASAPAISGETTTFTSSNCTGASGSNTWTSGACTPAGLNEAFMSGSITGDALNAPPSGCVVSYYSDDSCNTKVGPSFNPSSGQCLTAASFNDPNATQIVSVIVDCTGVDLGSS